jgi:hypothetical protein
MSMTDIPLNMSAAALRLATERPHFWEYRLFAQSLIDEVERSRLLLSSPHIGGRANIPEGNTIAWMQQRSDAFQRIVDDIVSLFSANHDDAFGPPGQPGCVDSILAFSRRVSALYRQTVEWLHSVRNADVGPRWREVTYELSFLADIIIHPI